MTSLAYPFAVARNKTLDWRPVLAPAVLVEAKQAYSLVLETGSDHGGSIVNHRWVDGSQRQWTLVYRSVPADSDMLGQSGAVRLTDRFGRELHLVEGVVVPGTPNVPTERAEELLDRAHDQAVRAFREFWPAEDESTEIRASTPIGFQDLSNAATRRLKPFMLGISLAASTVAVLLVVRSLKRRRSRPAAR